MKNPKTKPINEEEAEDWDFSDGFGGFPEEIDLKQNLGCASDRKKKARNLKEDNKDANQ